MGADYINPGNDLVRNWNIATSRGMISDEDAMRVLDAAKTSGINRDAIEEVRALFVEVSKIREAAEVEANAAQDELSNMRRKWKSSYRQGDKTEAKQIAQEEAALSHNAMQMTQVWKHAASNYTMASWLVHQVEAAWFVGECRKSLRHGKLDLVSEAALMAGIHLNALVADPPDEGVVSRRSLSRVLARLNEQEIDLVYERLDPENLELLRSHAAHLHLPLRERFDELYPTRDLLDEEDEEDAEPAPDKRRIRRSAMQRLKDRLSTKTSRRRRKKAQQAANTEDDDERQESVRMSEEDTVPGRRNTKSALQKLEEHFDPPSDTVEAETQPSKTAMQRLEERVAESDYEPLPAKSDKPRGSALRRLEERMTTEQEQDDETDADGKTAMEKLSERMAQRESDDLPEDDDDEAFEDEAPETAQASIEEPKQGSAIKKLEEKLAQSQGIEQGHDYLGQQPQSDIEEDEDEDEDEEAQHVKGDKPLHPVASMFARYRGKLKYPHGLPFDIEEEI